MPTATDHQRLELLSYQTANGKELIALAVEMTDDKNGGINVRVLMDAKVVNSVTIVPLQQGGCCN